MDKTHKQLFENLFVLELANNHWGQVERGLKIIDEFANVVRFNSVKAALKLQFRDVDNFIHPDFADNEELRYVDKTRRTKLDWADFGRMVKAISPSRISKEALVIATTPPNRSVIFLISIITLPI